MLLPLFDAQHSGDAAIAEKIPAFRRQIHHSGMNKPGSREIWIMTLERITENNLDFAVQIQAELFPGESGRANYEESVTGLSGYEYYLIWEDNSCIGVIGLYRYPEDPDSAWLGWFGIRKKHRRKHLGSAALKLFEDMALTKGFKFARLYTDAVNNDAAIAFYKANGYYCEPYRNRHDPVCAKIKTVIFSKDLTDGELILWNSRNIHLTEQIAKQEKYNRHQEPAGTGYRGEKR